MKNFKKITFLALCILFLALCILFAALTVCGAAAEEPPYVGWLLSADEETLMGHGKTYTAYASSQFDIYAKAKFVYEDTVECSDGTATVNSYEKGGEFVWLLAPDGYCDVYATDAGRQMLDRFLDGKDVLYRLRDASGDFADLDASIVQRIYNPSVVTMITKNVRELESLPRYELVSFDETDSFYYEYGCVYRFADGTYYYLDYCKLDNGHFDSDGEFSYRSGSVTLEQIGESISSALEKTAENTAERNTTVTHERDLYVTEEDPSDTEYAAFWTVGFWVVFALLGFIAPIPFLIVGFALPRSKKRGYPEYWYILAIIAGIWLLLAAVLLVVLVI